GAGEARSRPRAARLQGLWRRGSGGGQLDRGRPAEEPAHRSAYFGEVAAPAVTGRACRAPCPRARPARRRARASATMPGPMAEPDSPPARRGRVSGREARKARRAQPKAAPAYITRALPPYAPLDEEALLAIEAHADRLLDEIGMEIRGDAAALELWRR